MKKEFQIVLTAFMFYTRINVSKWVNYKEEYANQSSIYLPLIGWFVGAAVAGGYLLSSQILNELAAVIIGLLIGVLITGAFHEDGLADTCDGFGGGWKMEDILRIMKDSTIGAYGAIGLIFLFALKIALMTEIYV
ncbi:MAG: adenosylcobinamide-GDP ribazoletransferase [Crocinitomicaceae bacterium]|nr:adenosylcobinamide-GDP ribazoletransferase [Crocinitomicaceae bacterium]